ncbi:MAG: TIGR03915 family putative DNA repair protein [Peptococcaceae bacterium]|jgi:probable DNA metabolism protein|nr:TIGR03915 family putative DNA repair protein [Peptococcaceae bacterium]
MPDPKPLALPADVVYLYDGSLAGFFCCLFESVYLRELPADICPAAEASPVLFSQKQIVTDQEKARRARESIPKKIGPRALELVRNVFYGCLKQKELALLRFLLLAYREGGKIMAMRGHPALAPLLRAEGHLLREQHLLKGFIRFADSEGALTAVIAPKNFVLPYLAGHFARRFGEETFMIYDQTHKAALLCQKRRWRIIPLEWMAPPPAGETEAYYQGLWRQFYQTVAIPSRSNPRCRMTNMPKRYWANMTEMAEMAEVTEAAAGMRGVTEAPAPAGEAPLASPVSPSPVSPATRSIRYKP